MAVSVILLDGEDGPTHMFDRTSEWANKMSQIKFRSILFKVNITNISLELSVITLANWQNVNKLLI